MLMVLAPRPADVVHMRLRQTKPSWRNRRVQFASRVPRQYGSLIALCRLLLPKPSHGIALNKHFVGDGGIVFKHACKFGCESIVSKRLGSLYHSGN
jgi:hypothetical protein